MANLRINGERPEAINFNGYEVQTVRWNGDVVWTVGDSSSFPISDFNFNFNFKNYDSTTQTVPNEDTANWSQDLVISGSPNVDTDHITVSSSDAYAQFPFESNEANIFNRSSSLGYDMTIIFKVSGCSGVDLISNRGLYDTGGNASYCYNWMVRPQSSRRMYLHDSTGEKGGLQASVQPSIIVMTVSSSASLTISSTTDSTSTTTSVSMSYLSGRICFFCANYHNYNTTNISESFSGRCYWMFQANRVLTSDEITQVINYNENL